MTTRLRYEAVFLVLLTAALIGVVAPVAGPVL